MLARSRGGCALQQTQRGAGLLSLARSPRTSLLQRTVLSLEPGEGVHGLCTD